MKKCLSLVLSIVMLLSVFSVCGVFVSAADANNVYNVKTNGVVNGRVTYNIYLKANSPVTGAVVYVKYDKAVLQPTADTFDNKGAFVYKDEDGNINPNIPGEYVGGMVAGKTDTFSIGYMSINEYKSSSEKGFFSITFDVIDKERPITDVSFQCVEFNSSNEELHFYKNEANPQEFKVVQTDTFEKTVITGVTPAVNGMNITWKATVGADFYRVYKKNSKGGWDKLKDVSADKTNYVDTTARNGVKETYAVRAYNEGRTFKTYDQITGLYVASPAKVTASNAATGVKISWSAVSGADYYRVYKRVVNADGTKGDWKTFVTKTTAKTYTDTAVSSNTKYEYCVRVCMDGKWSASSVVGKVAYFAAPTVKLASATGGVKITWNKIDGAETYKIYRKYSGEKSWTAIGTVNADKLQFVDAKAKTCKTIEYAVRAFTEKNGSSNYVAKSLVYVATPKLASIANTKNAVQVKWSAVSGATGYRVYRKAANATSWTYITTVKTTYYNDKNVKSGTSYSYTVMAVYGSSRSSYEKGVSIKYLAQPSLTKVANVAAGIQVKWADVAGATGYKVYRKTGTGAWKLVGTTQNENYTDKSVVKGTTYKYTVRAYYGSTLSSYNTSGLSIKCK